jgi:transposase
MEKELQKDRVIKLYIKHKSKRKVAQIIGKTRQYVIQVIKEYEKENV